MAAQIGARNDVGGRLPNIAATQSRGLHGGVPGWLTDTPLDSLRVDGATKMTTYRLA